MAGGDRKDIFFFGREIEPQAAWESVLQRHNASLRRFTRRAACLGRLSKNPCDLLVVNFDGSPAEALEVLTEVGRICPSVSCLALVDRGDISAAVRAMKAGAVDCLERPVKQDELVPAVETALDRRPAPIPLHVHLTRTETQVLHLILAGMTNRDMADAFHRSKRTIEVHRRNIMRKLGATNVTALVRHAAALGLLK